ncbi:MAG: Xaa-Pro peptidase family protein [Betaproteobacteria bacterium]
MSRHDFSPDEFTARRARVAAAMRSLQLDWLVLFHPVSIHWLTGSDAKSYQEFQCLLVPADASCLTVLTREGERNEFEQDALVDKVLTFGGGENQDPISAFERLADTLGLCKASVGIEVPAYYLHPYHYLRIREMLGKALVAEPSNLVHDLKLVKSPAELGYIRLASQRADAAMAAFTTALQIGRSELALAGLVMQNLLEAGSGIAASPINLVSGERSCFSHGAPTERRLREGDFGNIEFGATCRRYTATIGRQFCIGRPTPRMRELVAVVRQASDACIARIRDGVPATEPHAAAKEVIAHAGLEAYRVHTTGYGLAPGFPPSWGEPLHMLADSPYTLRAGMVVSVEPPVFIGDEGLGARIIDNLLVTRDGTELLSRSNRDLIEVGVP